jgi:hypothetical protein
VLPIWVGCGGLTACSWPAAVGFRFPSSRAIADPSAFLSWLLVMEPLLVIVIVSSPSGSFSITTLRDGVDLASSFGLGSPMTTSSLLSYQLVLTESK